jgi:hypothetical protein
MLRKIHFLSTCAVVGFLLGAGIAWAQQNVTSGLYGNEAVVIAQGGPGGPSIYTTTGRLSSGPAYVYFAAFPASFTIGGLSGTINTAGLQTGGALLINAASTGTANYTLPPTSQLIDGEVISICNVTITPWATNVVTIVANTNQTIIGAGTSNVLTTLGANSCAGFQWLSGVSLWARATI